MLRAANSIYRLHFAVWPAKRGVLDRAVCHLDARVVIIIGILGGGVPPGSPNPDPNSDQKIDIFHTPFQGHKCDMKLRSLLRSEREQKDVLKIIPLKTIPDSTPKWAKTIPVSCFQTETVQKPYPLGRHIR